MEYIGRKGIIDVIDKQKWMSEQQYSKMLLLTGKKGFGKTFLLRNLLKYKKIVYLSINIKSKNLIFDDFQLGLELAFGKAEAMAFTYAKSFKEIFEILFRKARDLNFTLIIDNFHLFNQLEKGLASRFAELWKENRHSQNMFVILSGLEHDEISNLTDYTFNPEAPLGNCISTRISLDAFTISELKEILSMAHNDAGTSMTNEDLLVLYGLTSGRPRYVAYFIDKGACSKEDMGKAIFNSDSPFMQEPTSIVSSDLGAGANVYYSILQLLSQGYSSKHQIEKKLGLSNLGGYMDKLEKKYNLIQKLRPAFARDNERNVVRYYIEDNFLNFYFRYIVTNQVAIQLGDFDYVIGKIKRDFDEYSQFLLKKYFLKLYREEKGYDKSCMWWPEARSEGNKKTNPIYSHMDNSSLVEGFQDEVPIFMGDGREKPIIGLVSINESSILDNNGNLQEEYLILLEEIRNKYKSSRKGLVPNLDYQIMTLK